MRKIVLMGTCSLVLSLFSWVGWYTVVASETSAQAADVKSEFLELCDAGYPIVETQAHFSEVTSSTDHANAHQEMSQTPTCERLRMRLLSVFCLWICYHFLSRSNSSKLQLAGCV